MKITVLGAGKSGVSAAILAKKIGDTPFLSEYGKIDSIQALEKEKIPYEIGGHTEKALDCELLILSPGIKKELPIVKSFVDKNIPVISEIEYAYRNSAQPCIGITGSNGKTTTTTLLGRMLEKEFLGSRIAGNIGIPFADIASEQDKNPVVLELSSFQLETIDSFKPKTSILLNVSPNHLDWYSSYDDYINAKLNLLKNTDQDSELIINADDERLFKDTNNFSGKRYLFSLKEKNCNAYLENNQIVLDLGEKIHLCSINELTLSGPHHVMNMMAASLAAILNGVSIENIKKVIVEFSGLEHRMEFVRSVNGLKFINDSKSTSVEALKMALQSYSNPIILIAGGKHKGASYKYLGDLINENTKVVFVYGDAKYIMYEDWKTFGNIEKVQTIDEAVKKSLEVGEDGDVVLLSPACSSFDQFKSYEDRGEHYKSCINRI